VGRLDWIYGVGRKVPIDGKSTPILQGWLISVNRRLVLPARIIVTLLPFADAWASTTIPPSANDDDRHLFLSRRCPVETKWIVDETRVLTRTGNAAQRLGLGYCWVGHHPRCGRQTKPTLRTHQHVALLPKRPRASSSLDNPVSCMLYQNQTLTASHFREF